jgi:hypothetical protein
LASRQVHPGYVLGRSRRCSPPGTLPIGTYVAKISESHQDISIDALHPVGLLREDIDDQLLVLCSPLSIFWCVNDRFDLDLNVPLLFALLMQGNTAEI